MSPGTSHLTGGHPDNGGGPAVLPSLGVRQGWDLRRDAELWDGVRRDDVGPQSDLLAFVSFVSKHDVTYPEAVFCRGRRQVSFFHRYTYLLNHPHEFSERGN